MAACLKLKTRGKKEKNINIHRNEPLFYIYFLLYAYYICMAFQCAQTKIKSTRVSRYKKAEKLFFFIFIIEIYLWQKMKESAKKKKKRNKQTKYA